ncbi:MAG: hypothetical protein UU94_C0007G0034 [Candidatus Collierbacteria bacterium GW2011_GWB2_42_12]|nr:MAG: hypothetical protein UU94_C0007G0034 [Candidatus Collierbacteria bacterium GW2011_GWB2_42_12]
MILTAISIYFNLDRRFQTYIITKFPLYGAGLTKIEDIALVKERLNIVGQTNKIMVAPELIPGGDWFNSTPLTIQGLRGKVVLVDFWTYTCINCIRTLPYLHDWYEKYADNGLVIIGVHSPEFEFEKNPDNLAQAIIDFDIKYPVVQDNNFSTWRAYNNNYWPAKYLIDKDGDIRYTHFGEGEYDKTEQIIQELISEISGQKPEDQIANVIYSNEARTPEIYLGYGRGDSFASRDEEKIQSFKFPSSLSPNQVAFSGSWFVGREYIGAQIGSSLKLDFNAKDVFLVMRSTDKPVKISVYVDDVKQYFGKDNQDGEVTIDVDRLYHLITIPQAGRHILRLEFMEGGVEAYAFTFG